MPLTEANERLSALETHMASVLGILSKREDYQASVLKQLTVIEMKQDQAFTYQKHCDAERAAHGSRLGTLENDHQARRAADRLLRTQAGLLGSLSGFVVSVLTILSLVKH